MLSAPQIRGANHVCHCEGLAFCASETALGSIDVTGSAIVKGMSDMNPPIPSARHLQGTCHMSLRDLAGAVLLSCSG